MPTADEKPASLRTSKPFTYRKSESTCQEQAIRPSPPHSGGFFLLNFASPYREALALSLRLHRRRVIVPEEQGKTYVDFSDDEIRDTDYLFCDLTRKISHDEFQELRRICNLRKRDGMPLLVGCWLRKDRDYAFQLIVEKFFAARIVLCEIPLKP